MKFTLISSGRRSHRLGLVRCLATNAPTKRYAVVGAGFAGLATAWHLLDQVADNERLLVDVFEAARIGAGGSGAAAGLLHPFSPRGKLLWKADAALPEALRLLQVAEAAALEAGCSEPIAWRQGMLRPATSSKQARDFWKAWGGSSGSSGRNGGRGGSTGGGDEGSSSSCSSDDAQAARDGGGDTGVMAARCLSGAAAAALVPGVLTRVSRPAAAARKAQGGEPRWADTSVAGAPPGAAGGGSGGGAAGRGRQQREAQAAAEEAAAAAAAAAALHMPGGLTVHPQRYMWALWQACLRRAAARPAASAAVLHCGVQVRSLRELQASCPPYDAVVLATGAAVGCIEEVAGKLPLDLCQGFSLDLVPPPSGAASSTCQEAGCAGTIAGIQSSSSCPAEAPSSSSSSSYPTGGPSILGQPYLASQGGRVLIAGATKDGGWSSAAALQQCLRAGAANTAAGAAPAAAGAVPAATGAAPAAAAAGAAAAGCGGSYAWGSGVGGSTACTAGGDEPSGAAAAAVAQLLEGAAAAWPPVQQWRVAAVRSGVRALPPRTPHGSIPLVGRWPMAEDIPGDCWLLVGLGARGLVYHAWLAKLLAQGVVASSEQHVPPELLAWRQAYT